ncbi:MAG: type II secretion system F family protein [Syntrophothermus sp.]|uniref:type II secretion system F family protein n=1 Tax=Syntrophothermus sp. TaxID=2736299 RepID=UPI00257E2D04|nr:type II secretion system F family protein [Syntrophothermus sp.]NSW82723.1 type II secretion system F family protein [Syntrophothermus sp.]
MAEIIVLLSLSTAAIIFGVVYIAASIWQKHKKQAREKTLKKRLAMLKAGAVLPNWAEDWANKVEERLKRGNIGFRLVHYISLMSVLMVLAFLVGLVILKNLVAFGILVATAVIVPEHIVRHQIAKRKNMLLTQLGSAIRMLAAEHAGTPQITRAIIEVTPKLEYPLRGVFEKARNGILANRPLDDVLAQMLSELDFEYGRVFVQTVRLVADDHKMRDLLWWLAEQINAQLSDILDEQSSLAGERVMTIASIVILFPILFIMLALVPETYPFLVENTVGRAVACLCLAAPLANVLLDRMLSPL